MEDIQSKFNGDTIKNDSTGIVYQKGQLLGKGGFSYCYKCLDLKEQKIYALKELKNEDVSRNEIEIHKSLKHNNIVSYKDSIIDNDTVYIIVEFCENKDLASFFGENKKRKNLKEIEVQYFILQIIHALKYLHKRRIVHRDLKPGNIFLNKNLEVKIGDFGLAKQFAYMGEKIKHQGGTLQYMAPEVVENSESSFEVDIWAIGVIMYYLIIGKLPFRGSNQEETKEKIKKVDYTYQKDAIISEAAKDLISQILVKDPIKRPSLRQILMHDFFKLGRAIPKLIPISFKDKEPSIEYIRNFMVDADKNGIVNKEITTKDLKNLFPENKIVDNKEVNYDIYLKNCIFKYIGKYGISYRLNNGNFGVSFRDFSNIILIPGINKYYYFPTGYSNNTNNRIIGYLKDKDKILGNHDLEKKLKLLESFMKIGTIDNSSISQNNPNIFQKEDDYNENNEENPTYVKKYYKFDNISILLSLSNKNIQIYFFNGESILFSKKNDEAKFFSINKNELNCQVYPINTINENQNISIMKKLQYTKSLIEKVMYEDERRRLKI